MGLHAEVIEHQRYFGNYKSSVFVSQDVRKEMMRANPGFTITKTSIFRPIIFMALSGTLIYFLWSSLVNRSSSDAGGGGGILNALLNRSMDVTAETDVETRFSDVLVSNHNPKLKNNND